MKRKADDAGSGNKVEIEGVTGTFIPDELWQLTREDVYSGPPGWPPGGESGVKVLGLFQDPADARALAREHVAKEIGGSLNGRCSPLTARMTSSLLLKDNATFTYEQYLAGVEGAWEDVRCAYDYTGGTKNSRYHGESRLNDGSYLIWCNNDPDEACGETQTTNLKIKRYEVPYMKFTSSRKKAADEKDAPPPPMPGAKEDDDKEDQQKQKQKQKQKQDQAEGEDENAKEHQV